MRCVLRSARAFALGFCHIRGGRCMPASAALTPNLWPPTSAADRYRLAQVDGVAVMPTEYGDQPIGLVGNLVNDGAEICFTHYDIVEPHLPDRRGPGVDECGGGGTQKFKQLQTCWCRHHQLAVGCEQILTFETLDNFGTRSRCADAFRLLQSLTQCL